MVGYHCNGLGLLKPLGKCDSGFYCLEGSSTPRPIGTRGDICPMGHYCPEGTGASQPECPAGKYSLTRGLRAEAECHNCPEGFFCGAGTANYLKNPCPPGHYCPAGTKKAKDNPCPAGKFTALKRYPNVNESSACRN